MPPKSTRVQKPANRLPKSLVALPIDPPIVPEPSLDPKPIDPQLLDIDRQFSPFSDSRIEGTQPQNPSSFDISQLPSTYIQGRRRGSTSSDPF